MVGLDQPGTSAATVLPGARVTRVIDKLVFDRYMPIALSHASNQSPTLNGVALPGGVIPFLADDLRFVLSQVEILDHDDPILSGHIDTRRVAPSACLWAAMSLLKRAIAIKGSAPALRSTPERQRPSHEMVWCSRS